MTDSQDPRHTHSANHLISSYNIPGGFPGLGPAVLCHLLHDMEDGHDAQQLLTSSRTVSEIRSFELFKWALSKILSRAYQLKNIPLDKTDLNEFTSYYLDQLTSDNNHIISSLKDILSTTVSNDQPKMKLLLSQNIIPRLFNLLTRNSEAESNKDETERNKEEEEEKKNEEEEEGKENEEEERKRKKRIDLYCIRILTQFRMHSDASLLQGSYSDSHFASLLQSSLLSESDYLSYGAWTILGPWINSSSSHKDLISPIALLSSSLSLFASCPTKNEGEYDWNFKNRLKPYLTSLQRSLSIIRFIIRIGMNDECKKTLIESLTTLQLHINNTEHSFAYKWDAPKKEINTVKRKIEILMRLIRDEDANDDDGIEEDIKTINGNSIIHLIAEEAEEEDNAKEAIMREINSLMNDKMKKYHHFLNHPFIEHNNTKQTNSIPFDISKPSIVTINNNTLEHQGGDNSEEEKVVIRIGEWISNGIYRLEMKIIKAGACWVTEHDSDYLQSLFFLSIYSRQDYPLVPGWDKTGSPLSKGPALPSPTWTPTGTLVCDLRLSSDNGAQPGSWVLAVIPNQHNDAMCLDNFDYVLESMINNRCLKC